MTTKKTTKRRKKKLNRKIQEESYFRLRSQENKEEAKIKRYLDKLFIEFFVFNTKEFSVFYNVTRLEIRTTILNKYPKSTKLDEYS